MNSHPLFYINRDGIPVSPENLEKMKNFCVDRTMDNPEVQNNLEKVYNSYQKQLGSVNFSSIKKPPTPSKPPVYTKDHDAIQFVEKCQNYMFSLAYNHTGMQFYNIDKTRSLTRLLEVAKNMIKYSLPIKCLEAVVLGIHLTNPCPSEIIRFTLSFKSRHVQSKTSHYHVLLGVYIQKHATYGCIGMSRKTELAYKKLGVHHSLNELILDIKGSYESVGHKLKRVSCGMPISHDACSLEAIDWTTLVIEMGEIDSDEALARQVERFSKLLRKNQDRL